MPHQAPLLPVHPAGQAILRSMDSMEEFFWLLRFPAPYRYVCAAVVEGSTTVEEWRTAWDAVQPFFGVLSASVSKAPGSRPAFVPRHSPYSLHVQSWQPGLDADRAMADRLNDDSEDWDQILLRPTLLHTSGRSMLLLTAHHSGSDGLTCLAILQSLLSAMVGKPPAAAAVWAAPSLLLGRPTPAAYRHVLPAGLHPGSGLAETPPAKLQVRSLVLSAEETRRLAETARGEQATVHGALLAAFALALQERGSGPEGRPIECSTPINIRPLVNAPSAAGVLLSIHAAPVGWGGEPLWERARRISADLELGRTLQAAQRRVDALNELVADEMTFGMMAQRLERGLFRKDLTLTNLGRNPIPTDYGRLRIVALSGAVHSGGPGAQTISAVTLHDELTLTQISRQPVPLLLEEGREILARACSRRPHE